LIQKTNEKHHQNKQNKTTKISLDSFLQREFEQLKASTLFEMARDVAAGMKYVCLLLFCVVCYFCVVSIIYYICLVCFIYLFLFGDFLASKRLIHLLFFFILLFIRSFIYFYLLFYFILVVDFWLRKV
jgi:hypothetical protein